MFNTPPLSHSSHLTQVTFYTRESVASNHAGREAACTCIAELGSKVSSDCLRPHVPQLTSKLLDCFKDDSWPVRDGECTCTCSWYSIIVTWGNLRVIF